VAQEDNLVLVQMTPQELGDFDSILRHSINGHGICHRRAGRFQRSACATLVPLDDRELFLPRQEQRSQGQPFRPRPP
jgi:hypothetical protein